MQGFVTYTGSPPSILWKKYSGSGTVTFGNAAVTNTTASFSAPGVYTLEISAADGVHAVAYDATVITVTNAISVAAVAAGANVILTWSGGTQPYVVQMASSLSPASWSNVATTSLQNASIPIVGTQGYFRLRDSELDY